MQQRDHCLSSLTSKTPRSLLGNTSRKSSHSLVSTKPLASYFVEKFRAVVKETAQKIAHQNDEIAPACFVARGRMFVQENGRHWHDSLAVQVKISL